jgi:hypothetical protein
LSEYIYHDPDRGEEIRRRQIAAERRLKENEGKRFWDRCLADPVGRKEIWALLNDRLNAFRTEFPFSPAGLPDQFAVWFKHGRSTAGFEFAQYLQMCSRDGFREMQDEYDPRFQPEPLDQPSAVDEQISPTAL